MKSNLDKLKLLLIDSSNGRHHYNNIAKEYVIVEDDDNNVWLELGKDCCIIDNQYLILYSINKDNNKVVATVFKGKYSIVFGVSLTNICHLLTRKNWNVLSIAKVLENYYSFYVITFSDENYNSIHSFKFKETWNLKEFADSDLCSFILNVVYNNIFDVDL